MELTFILTEECNLRCTYCYQKNYPRSVMPVPVALSAIDGAIRNGARRLELTFFGGEPLLQAGPLFEILGRARELERERGIPITAKTSTNGLALDDRVIAQAARLGLFISLSHDGVREAMDAGRVTPEGASAFDRVEAALRRLVAARMPFGVYSVITPGNVRYLARSRRHLWEAGARLLISAIDYTADWDPDALRRLLKQYEELGDFYRSLLRERRDMHFEPFDSRISQVTRPADWKSCAPGVRHVTVAPDGALYGCVEYFYRRLGSIGRAETWLDAARLRELSRNRQHPPDECGDCVLNDRCNNDCACINLRTTGQANVPPASLCITEQETIRAADRLAARLYRERLPEFLLRHYSGSYHLLSSVERWLESMGVSHEPAEAGPRSL
ncbi:MAG: radical SAM protein [Planctomycetes bacterium]|nr:radical SAM protein [Planctomycetota bacterium]